MCRDQMEGLRPLHFFACGLLLVVVYSLGVSGLVLMDDNLLKGLAESARQGWASVFSFALDGPAVTARRPIPMLTFAIQAKLASADPAVSRIVNILIHVGNSALLFAATRAACARAECRHPIAVAVLATAAWAAMPAHATAVLYPIQRMTLLAGTFSIAVVWMMLGDTTPRRIALALLLYAAGIMCKENAVLALPVALLLRGLLSSDEATRLNTYRALAASAWALVAGALLFSRELEVLLAYSERDFELLERLALAPGMLAQYAMAAAFPGPHGFSFYYDDYAMSSDIGIVSLLVLAAAPLGVMVLGRLSSASRLAAGGLAAFIVLHSLEGTVWPLELYFEHRNYLPSIGIAWALAAGLCSMPLRWSRIAASVLLLWFAAVLAWRADVIGDQLRLASHHVRTHPASYRAVRDAVALEVMTVDEAVDAGYPYPVELDAIRIREACRASGSTAPVRLLADARSVVPLRSAPLHAGTLESCESPCAVPDRHLALVGNRIFSVAEGSRLRREYGEALQRFLARRARADCPPVR